MEAETANEKAVAPDRAAAEADRRATAAQRGTQQALNRMETVADRIASLDQYSVADYAAVPFNFNSDALSQEAMSRLDDILGSVSERQSGYLVELQGFTDN